MYKSFLKLFLILNGLSIVSVKSFDIFSNNLKSSTLLILSDGININPMNNWFDMSFNSFCKLLISFWKLFLLMFLFVFLLFVLFISELFIVFSISFILSLIW